MYVKCGYSRFILDDLESDESIQATLNSVLTVKRLDIPTIAAINGFSFGWGMELGA